MTEQDPGQFDDLERQLRAEFTVLTPSADSVRAHAAAEEAMTRTARTRRWLAPVAAAAAVAALGLGAYAVTGGPGGGTNPAGDGPLPACPTTSMPSSTSSTWITTSQYDRTTGVWTIRVIDVPVPLAVRLSEPPSTSLQLSTVDGRPAVIAVPTDGSGVTTYVYDPVGRTWRVESPATFSLPANPPASTSPTSSCDGPSSTPAAPQVSSTPAPDPAGPTTSISVGTGSYSGSATGSATAPPTTTPVLPTTPGSPTASFPGNGSTPTSSASNG